MTTSSNPWWSSIENGAPDVNAILAGRPDVAAAVNSGQITADQWINQFGGNEANQAAQQFAQGVPGQNPQQPAPGSAANPYGSTQPAFLPGNSGAANGGWSGVGTSNPDGSSNLYNWAMTNNQSDVSPGSGFTTLPDGSRVANNGAITYDAAGNPSNGFTAFSGTGQGAFGSSASPNAFSLGNGLSGFGYGSQQSGLGAFGSAGSGTSGNVQPANLNWLLSALGSSNSNPYGFQQTASAQPKGGFRF